MRKFGLIASILVLIAYIIYTIWIFLYPIKRDYEKERLTFKWDKIILKAMDQGLEEGFIYSTYGKSNAHAIAIQEGLESLDFKISHFCFSAETNTDLIQEPDPSNPSSIQEYNEGPKNKDRLDNLNDLFELYNKHGDNSKGIILLQAVDFKQGKSKLKNFLKGGGTLVMKSPIVGLSENMLKTLKVYMKKGQVVLLSPMRIKNLKSFDVFTKSSPKEYFDLFHTVMAKEDSERFYKEFKKKLSKDNDDDEEEDEE